jgi:hypothetical protein
MAKTQLIRLGCVVLGVLASSCKVDEPCMDNDPELIEKFGVPEHQTEGPDGLCYTVDPQVKNWGASCDSLELCGGGLICPGEELPICTAVGCNPDPKKDKVCSKGFTCVETGDVEVPTICIPLPPAPPAPPPSTPIATEEEQTSSPSELGDAGASDSGSETSAEVTGDPSDAGASTEAPVVEPNIGTACGAADDTVCVGGTFCEAQSLHYCTVPNCAAGLENEAACASVGFCYSTAPAPATGICTVQ